MQQRSDSQINGSSSHIQGNGQNIQVAQRTDKDKDSGRLKTPSSDTISDKLCVVCHTHFFVYTPPDTWSRCMSLCTTSSHMFSHMFQLQDDRTILNTCPMYISTFFMHVYVEAESPHANKLSGKTKPKLFTPSALFLT
jgi:hypothetical protein